MQQGRINVKEDAPLDGAKALVEYIKRTYKIENQS